MGFSAGNDTLVLPMEDFTRKAPLPSHRRLALRNHFPTMGYGLPDDVLG